MKKRKENMALASVSLVAQAANSACFLSSQRTLLPDAGGQLRGSRGIMGGRWAEGLSPITVYTALAEIQWEQFLFS